MTFVTAGLAAAGVAAIAIPILIFMLWRQRRTPIAWGAMRFLLEAYRRHRRRLRLEQLLLLLVRCLIVALFGAALARPVLERAGVLDTGGARTVYFIVDDGLVTAARNEAGESALARHVTRAAAIMDELGPADRVGLITAARPARTVLSPPSSDHTAVLQLLESLSPSPAPSDLPGAFDRLRTIVGGMDADADQIFVYLLSDFRAGSVALDGPPPTIGVDDDMGDRVVLLAAPPAVETIANVQITSVDAVRTMLLAGAVDGSGQVTVRLARQGADLGRQVSTVRLVGDSLGSVTPRTIEWAPGQSEATTDFMLDFDRGRERDVGVTVTIDADALAADNDRHLVLALRDELRVVLVDRRSFGLEPGLDRLTAGQWIRRALAPGESGPLEVVTIEPASLDERDLRLADAVVLPRPDLLPDDGWTLLRSFVDAGGLAIILPPGEINVHRWTDRIETSLGLPWVLARETVTFEGGMVLADEQPSSAVLRMIGADLAELGRPVIVRRMLPVDAEQTRAETLLRLADGSPLMIAGSPETAVHDDSQSVGPGVGPGMGSGLGLVLYLAAAPQLDWTNLPSKPLMVPLLHESLRQGLSVVRSAGAVGVGEQPPLVVGPAARRLVGPEGERILLTGGRPAEPLARPGRYRVVDGAGQDVGAVAVNIEPAAGRTDPQAVSAVTSWLARSGPWSLIDDTDPGAELRSAAGGSPIAGLLLLLVFVLLVVETACARWFSHAAETGPTGERRGGLQPTMSEGLDRDGRRAGAGVGAMSGVQTGGAA